VNLTFSLFSGAGGNGADGAVYVIYTA
jgi:hypothetical protein